VTPYEITSLGIILSFYLMKWLRKREKKLEEEIWEPNFASPWQKAQRTADNNINTEAKVVARTPQGTVYDRPIIKGSFNTLLVPGLRELFEEQTGIYEVYIGVDPAVEIYDEEYWRTWKAKHKHEEDGG